MQALEKILYGSFFLCSLKTVGNELHGSVSFFRGALKNEMVSKGYQELARYGLDGTSLA